MGNSNLEAQFIAPRDLQTAYHNGLERMQQENTARRIWDHDAALWQSDPNVQGAIKNRLGWLDVAITTLENLSEITDFVNQVTQDGYTFAVLLGMGGSSLAPEMLREAFETTDSLMQLIVLDTTDPDTIHEVERIIDLPKTLFIVASKSGKTLETLSHFKYFSDKVSKLSGENIGQHFIAITDPGTPLEQLARENSFRHIFLNPADIGGRYSVFSYFGMVPAALMGLDIEQLLVRGLTMMGACGEGAEDGINQDAHNPGLALGAILGALGSSGRDKVTFFISPEIDSFGLWVEQLLAESTGKNGRGLVPVVDEQPGSPDVYGDDRLFAYLRLQNGSNAALDTEIEALERAGQPVVRINLDGRYDVGGEFFRWEFATAVAGIFLGINPFDEPNVQESKDNTNRILAEYEREGHLPMPEPVVTYGNAEIKGQEFRHEGQAPKQGWVEVNAPIIRVYGPDLNQHTSVSDYLHTFLNQANIGEYIALMAYVQITDETDNALESLRVVLRDMHRAATTLGYGPRFLHSTGQLHKGGANNGVFIQITSDERQDAPIPGEPYTFGVLKAAQALGDLRSLNDHGRRVVGIHISGDLVQGIHIIEQAVKEQL